MLQRIEILPKTIKYEEHETKMTSVRYSRNHLKFVVPGFLITQQLSYPRVWEMEMGNDQRSFHYLC